MIDSGNLLTCAPDGRAAEAFRRLTANDPFDGARMRWAPPVLEPRHCLPPRAFVCVFCGVELAGAEVVCSAPACVAQENG